LPHLLLLLMRLFAPFAVAVAIDKGLAARLTWQWLWGMVALSIILPPLSQFLRIAAYVAGNLALQVGDPAPIWNWDYATMTMLKSSPGDPAQLVNVGFVTMLIMSFMLMASVVIAYQITYGKVYETGSSLISAAIFGGAATGVGAVSAASAASLSRTAETTQITGQSRAESETLKGQKESADIRDTGGAVAGRAASKSSANQGAATAESGSVATVERARSTYEKTVRESEATHHRTLTESQGRTEATDVEAQNAANQARSGMSGTIVDAGKGVGRWLTGGTPAGGEGGAAERNDGLPTTGAMMSRVGSLGPGAPYQPPRAEQGVGGPVGNQSAGQQYGAPRDYDRDGAKDEHHTGLDYGRAQGYHEGTRVGAAAKGRVLFAGRDGGYGNRVVIDHGNGVATTYSHLQEGSIDNLAVGQEVQRGAMIGRVGSTGGKYAPHLHFEAGALAGGTDKHGAPNIAKVDPATTSYRPMNLGKGVDPHAAMPTQVGQATREAARLREQATVNASDDYRAAIISSSEVARDDEIGISTRQAQRDVSINWTAHGMRVAGIDQQEKMNLRANDVMYDHGRRAMEERRDSSLDAAAIREKAAVVSALGSIAAQQVGRLDAAFRF
ncbi:MAG TPA: M23 family metallopeptidase, partial [Pyrinomonadaceae bacterium]